MTETPEMPQEDTLKSKPGRAHLGEPEEKAVSYMCLFPLQKADIKSPGRGLQLTQQVSAGPKRPHSRF